MHGFNRACKRQKPKNLHKVLTEIDKLIQAYETIGDGLMEGLSES